LREIGLQIRRGDSFQKSDERGFTIIELVIAMGLLAIVSASLAGVFYGAIRTAGDANHRTDGAAIASREIEGMHAVPYAQVGFYDDQFGVTATFHNSLMNDTLTTVSLGPTSPASGSLVPQMQPETPDPNAAVGYAPDPNPANASAITQGSITFTIERHVVWVNAADASTTYTQAYKRLTVIVHWHDTAGDHAVQEDSILYPGGLGQYVGPMDVATSTTSTTTPLLPSVPNLASINQLAAPAGETQMPLVWSQPGGGAAVTSYTIEYSTDSGFQPGKITVISGLAPSVTTYTVTSLTASTKYFFEIIAYAGANTATSNVQSQTTQAPGPTCSLGPLNVTGATSLSTTGTNLLNNGKMSENLTLSWTTQGPCPNDNYQVRATDPSNATDPGSPYTLNGSSGSYTSSIASSGSHGWGIGLHTFTVWDISTNSTTTVVKTFKVCAQGVSPC
jgi:prepilin-type N-terminal cleavage/methylation domain-containing protein